MRGSRRAFRCCLCQWTRTLGLDANFRATESKGFLTDESDHELFNHGATEVLLTTNGLMKFGSVVLPNHLYAPSEPNQGRNAIVREGDRVVLDSDGYQRPCVSTSNSRWIVGHGNVVVSRKFFYDPHFVPDLHSWAQVGENISILVDCDALMGPIEVWRNQEAPGPRLYRTNPKNQAWGFPVPVSRRTEDDQYVFPLGMNSDLSPAILERLLVQHRRSVAEKETFLACRCVRKECAQRIPSAFRHHHRDADQVVPVSRPA